MTRPPHVQLMDGPAWERWFVAIGLPLILVGIKLAFAAWGRA